ncbi:GTP-binding protein [Undibacterium curvum]|uniref:GTP-binding protein n=1 Tax=Undibacterium curvum TaxID=2762294 RepID=UPI003D11C5C6
MTDNSTRIALVGCMGIGKTTAIRAVCGTAVTDCDVPNLDTAQHQKETTTVGVEFGEVDLGDGDKLQLYGCPGQERFNFVRSWILSLSHGVFVMVDVNDRNALEQAASLLTEISDQHTHCVAAILSSRPTTSTQFASFATKLEQRQGYVTPILQADVRNRHEILEALQVLASMLMFRNSIL